jgi:hypothetical protein
MKCEFKRANVAAGRVALKWEMTLKVHSVVQYPHDFNRCFWDHPVHQEVTSAPALSRNVDRTKT